MTTGKTRIIAIGGPTASGKSSLAMALGGLASVELLNFDSMQIYRGMDIGTAKPGKEDRETLPHHEGKLRAIQANPLSTTMPGRSQIRQQPCVHIERNVLSILGF